MGFQTRVAKKKKKAAKNVQIGKMLEKNYVFFSVEKKQTCHAEKCLTFLFFT